MGTIREGSKVRLVRVDAERDGQRLDNFVTAQLPGVPRSVIYRVIRKGQVRVNGGRAKPHTRLSSDDEVRIPPAQVAPKNTTVVPDAIVSALRAAIVHQQDEFLVLNKPAGMAVHGGTGIRWGVIDGLRQLFPDESLELVHRIDRETSGCLLIARNAQALRHLRSQFREHNTEKRYMCLLQGRMREERVVVDQPLRRYERSGERLVEVHESGKSANTEFRLLQHYARHSFVEAIPLTGRTHQIRVHAVFLGMPLAGDSKYAKTHDTQKWQQRGLRRLFLHAHGLAFTLEDGERVQFNIPLPEDLRTILDAL